MKSTAILLLALAARAHAQCPPDSPMAGTGGVSCFIHACNPPHPSATCSVRGATCRVDYCVGCEAIWSITNNDGSATVVTDRCDVTTAAPEVTERQCNGGMCPGNYRPVCTTACTTYPNACSAQDCEWSEDQFTDGACAANCAAVTTRPTATRPPTPPPTRGSSGCLGITCPAGVECDGRMCNRMLNRTCAGGIDYSNPCHALSCGFREEDISIGACIGVVTTVPPPTTQQCGEMICPGVWTPVCGRDGITYGNVCEARRCRQVSTPGECGATDPTTAPPSPPPTRPEPTMPNCPMCDVPPPRPGCWYDHSDETRNDDGCLVYPCGVMMCSSTTAPGTRGPPGETCLRASPNCPMASCIAPPAGCVPFSGRLPNVWDTQGTMCCPCTSCAFLSRDGGECPQFSLPASCGEFNARPTVAPSTEAPTVPMETFSPTPAPTDTPPSVSPTRVFQLSSCGLSQAALIQTAAGAASYYNNVDEPVVIPGFADAGCATIATAFAGYGTASAVTFELMVDGATVDTDYTVQFSTSGSMTIQIRSRMLASVNYPAMLVATDGRSNVTIAAWALIVRVRTAPPTTAQPTLDGDYTTVPFTPTDAVPALPADIQVSTSITNARRDLLNARRELNGITDAYNVLASRYQAGEALSPNEMVNLQQWYYRDLHVQRQNLDVAQAAFDAALADASTQPPNTPGKSSSKDKDEGTDLVTIISIVVIGLVIVGGIAVFVMVKLKLKTNGADTRNFSNPTYDGVSAASPGMGGQQPNSQYEHESPGPHYDEDDVDV